MNEKSRGSPTTPTGRTLTERIHTIYERADESTVHEMTTLLVTALRDGDHRSRSALAQFFGLPVMPEAELEVAKLDFALLRNAILFINGENANRVETWLASYKKSPPHSRSLPENILRNFVSSKTEVTELKSQVKQAHSFATDARLKCEELERIIKSMQQNGENRTGMRRAPVNPPC
jgi:hypothetical protein